MGANKDTLEFAGSTVIGNVLERHYEAGIDRVFLCGVDDRAGSERFLESEGEEKWKGGFKFIESGYPWVLQLCRSIEDASDDGGEQFYLRHPILGIYHALNFADEKGCNLVFLTSNDVPILDPLLVSTLHANLPNGCRGVMAQMADGTAAPLLSLLRPKELLSNLEKEHKDTLDALLNDEKTPSVTDALLGAGVEIVSASTLSDAGVDLTRLEGANTLEELNKLEHRWSALN